MSVVLENHQDPNYEPTQSEIVEYGKWLGMDLPADNDLLWIARNGLKAPLPENWKACKSEKGELYYFNFKTGQSLWDHPMDDHFKQLFKREKTKNSEGDSTATTTTTSSSSSSSSSNGNGNGTTILVDSKPSSLSAIGGGSAVTTTTSALDGGSAADGGDAAASTGTSTTRGLRLKRKKENATSASLASASVVVADPSGSSSSTPAGHTMRSHSSGKSYNTSNITSSSSSLMPSLSFTPAPIVGIMSSGSSSQYQSTSKQMQAQQQHHANNTAEDASFNSQSMAATDGHSGTEDDTNTNSSKSSPKAAAASGRVSKIQVLKTLKVKKEAPPELVLDVLPSISSNGGTGNGSGSGSGSKSSAVDAPTPIVGELKLGGNKVPLGSLQKTPTALSSSHVSSAAMTPAGASYSAAGHSNPVKVPVETPEAAGPSSAAKVTPIGQLVASPSDNVTSASSTSTSSGGGSSALSMSSSAAATTRGESSEGGGSHPRSSSVSKRRQVSFLSQAEKDGVSQELAAQLAAFKAEEERRMVDDKDEFTRTLDMALKKAKNVAKLQHAKELNQFEKAALAKLEEDKHRIAHDLKKQLHDYDSHERQALAEDTFVKLRKDFSEKAIQELEHQASEFMKVVDSKYSSLLSMVKRQAEVVELERCMMAQHELRVKQLEAQLASDEATLRTTHLTKLHDTEKSLAEAMTKFREEEQQAAALHGRTMQALRDAHAEELTAAKALLCAAAGKELEAVKKETAVAIASTASAASSSVASSVVAAAAAPQPQQWHAPCMPTFASSILPLEGMLLPAAAAADQEHAPLAVDTSDDSVDLFNDLGETLPPHQIKAAATTATANSSGKQQRQAPIVMPLETQDLRTVVTEVLRDLFKNSPFILPSPNAPATTADQPAAAIATTTTMAAGTSNGAPHFGRDVTNHPVTMMSPAPPRKSSLGDHTALASTRMAEIATNTSSTTHLLCSPGPTSFTEQKQLLRDERDRLVEAQQFVRKQRDNLEERTAQLKTARKHWKADVIAAKSQGIGATSRKGQLLHKVQHVLDKQAQGLKLDEALLADSEQWLESKEQRLLKLEEQMGEHERSMSTEKGRRGGGLDVSATSVDTQLLVTGFFKPAPLGDQLMLATTAAAVGPRPPSRNAQHPAGAVFYSAGEQQRPSSNGYTAAPMMEAAATQQRSSRKASSSTRYANGTPGSSSGNPNAALLYVDPAAAQPQWGQQQQMAGPSTASHRSISPMLTQALERIEARLDKVTTLMHVGGSAGGVNGAGLSSSSRHHHHSSSHHQYPQQQQRQRSGSSGSHKKRVDFAVRPFADAWTELAVVGGQ